MLKEVVTWDLAVVDQQVAHVVSQSTIDTLNVPPHVLARPCCTCVVHAAARRRHRRRGLCSGGVPSGTLIQSGLEVDFDSLRQPINARIRHLPASVPACRKGGTLAVNVDGGIRSYLHPLSRMLLEFPLDVVKEWANNAPLIAALLSPASTLYDIPALSQRWYSFNGAELPDPQSSLILSGFSLAGSIIANALLLLRFSVRWSKVGKRHDV